MSSKRPVSPKTPSMQGSTGETPQSAKKPRISETKINGDIQITAGARWIIEQLDKMQGYYAVCTISLSISPSVEFRMDCADGDIDTQEAILAAASMLQFQTYAKSLYARPLPSKRAQC